MSIPGLKKGGRAVFTALALLLLPVDAESQASRKVLVEEFTGMWCGDCPMGQSACNHLDSAFGPRVICISLHNMDILSSAYSDQLVNDINVTEFPVAFVDRNPFDSDGGVFQFPDDGIRSWDPAVKQRIKTDAPLSLAISSTYDVETRQMSAAIQVKAETLLNGKMRLNCV
ncbi:MAG TPA: hypothetical protein VNZ86_03360, partial [Bacteroidia bacterium]|nr:hypothetical protein [Bacteroidia bacterium]